MALRPHLGLPWSRFDAYLGARAANDGRHLVNATVRRAPTTCAACDAQLVRLDAKNFGLYVAEDGELYPHFLCKACMARALGSDAGHAEVAELVELRLSPSAGAA